MTDLKDALEAHEKVCNQRHIEIISRLVLLESRQSMMFKVFSGALGVIVALMLKQFFV